MAFIDIGGLALRYDLGGDGSPLVLVHEMAGMLESWNQVVPALRAQHRVLRYDTRHAGLSEKPVGPVSFEDMANDLAGLLDAVGITEPVTVAGCAVGAGISLALAVYHPERVRGVVAMAPATGIVPERQAAVLTLADSIEREGLRAVVEASFEPSYPPAVRHDLAVYEETKARWIGNDRHSFAAIYRMLAASRLDEEMGSIRVPVLFLAGQHDPMRTPAVTETLSRRVAGSRYMTLDTGHFMAIQTPALIANHILDFMQGL